LVSRRSPTHLAVYILAVVFAEAVIAFVDLYFGLALHALLLFVPLTHYSLKAEVHHGAGASDDPSWVALPAICFVPLLRILSATMPVKGIDPLYWTGLTGSALLLGVFAVKRANLSWSTLGLSTRGWPAQVLMGSSGAGLGLLGFAVLSPPAAFGESRQQSLAVLLVLLAFAGLVEEVVFRGMIQGLLEKTHPAYSVLGSSILFSAAYLGSERISEAAFITVAGFYFGWWVKRTKSVVGVSLAHALMNLGMFVVWPLVFG
jgi:uncharacterized protein